MSRFSFAGKLLVGLAALLALLASLVIFFTPQVVYEITATLDGDDTAASEAVAIQRSWYQVQGLWGVIVLIVAAALFGLAFYLAWREATAWLALLAAGLLGLVYLAGFSIGLYYLPAVLVLWAGTIVMLLARYRQRRANETSD